MSEPQLGDSAAQREAEAAVLLLLREELDLPSLDPITLALTGGARVQVDAVSFDPPVLVEIWAHQGPLRGGQPNKVMVDAMKLMYVEEVKRTPFRKIICFTDAKARKPFLGKSWRAAALAHWGIEMIVADLPDALRAKVVQAQKDQYR
jgi:hypothetical protein